VVGKKARKRNGRGVLPKGREKGKEIRNRSRSSEKEQGIPERADSPEGDIYEKRLTKISAGGRREPGTIPEEVLERSLEAKGRTTGRNCLAGGGISIFSLKTGGT